MNLKFKGKLTLVFYPNLVTVQLVGREGILIPQCLYNPDIECKSLISGISPLRYSLSIQEYKALFISRFLRVYTNLSLNKNVDALSKVIGKVH